MQAIWNYGSELVDGATVLSPTLSSLARDVIQGLSKTPKSIPSKHFYDDQGSRLFQQITQQSEYYLTRCELEIIETHGRRIAAEFGTAPLRLIELGVGDGHKTAVLLRSLLERGADFEFTPIDICPEAIDVATDSLCRQMPDLVSRIHGVAAEYLDGLASLGDCGRRRNVVLFLGSNIGNLSQPEARRFLRRVAGVLAPGDLLFVGFDLKKHVAVLEAAYNDAAGVTREFNFNLLDRINRELDGDFVRDRFTHYAPYNPRVGCMESWLISRTRQTVHLRAVDRRFEFDPWEGILLERSHKYSLDDIEDLASAGGFHVREHFLDRRRFFADSLWEKRGE
jgi:dimethylhistidine N-methyltransferase